MPSLSPELLRRCLRSILRPLIEFCVARAIRFQDFEENSKLVFLDSAQRALEREGQDVSVSRLSAMTGIHRRDVMRLWRDRTPLKEDADVITRVIGKWQHDRRFLTRTGRPQVLTLQGKSGSFRTLVLSVSSDLNPYTVLRELERAGAVERGEGTEIKLVSRSYQPDGVVEAFELLGSDIDELIASIVANLQRQRRGTRNHHIKTYFDNIPVEYAEEIREWLLEKGAKYHREVREYLAQHDRDLNPKLDPEGKTARVAFVSFSRAEEILPSIPSTNERRRIAKPARNRKKANRE